MAAIGAAMMMLDTIGESKAAQGIEAAMIAVMQKMKSQAAGQMGMSTTEVGDSIANLVAKQ
jgi:3-isopropylmalate dehydrogenase